MLQWRLKQLWSLFASVGSLSEASFLWVCPDDMHASMCSTLATHCCHLILLTLTWSNEICHSGSSSSTSVL
ncbi:uncharacterized protein K444DRAFT_23128 [Hyaloscypha bicolor E]|uniref:Secreted protein n=1 Tax=Hyaloscypha bicolor E TaxID=1095630 RepID=A0A2J6T4P6_9HELO|nr:uncharacterized protein K444DRAFT_23128 [Hyaloscypha bicolor E]PMD57991.1 hypothetical protein K444DRAFT_23128 [Hyaloscypha bicolor E]